MTKSCLICFTLFITYPSKIKLGRGKYCSTHCANISFKGKHFSPKTEIKKGQDIDPSHKGWRYVQARKNGNRYKEIHIPTHPNATSHGYVREHRLIMERMLGRYLESFEVVHHVNGNTLDNSVENLKVMTKKEHDALPEGGCLPPPSYGTHDYITA